MRGPKQFSSEHRTQGAVPPVLHTRDNHIPHPAGHTVSDAEVECIGLSVQLQNDMFYLFLFILILTPLDQIKRKKGRSPVLQLLRVIDISLEHFSFKNLPVVSIPVIFIYLLGETINSLSS